VRDGDGEVAAIFTDGARTAVLTGRSRTFAEPRTTAAKVVTDNWVRLLPRAWSKGAERSAWFRTWFTNGPAMGDLGGAARLDGKGMYAKYLTNAKRL
jgi:hypothetical protein